MTKRHRLSRLLYRLFQEPRDTPVHVDCVVLRPETWLPRVLDVDGTGRLGIEIIGDSEHNPRRFTVPIAEGHLDVIKESPPRHVLLRSAEAEKLELSSRADLGGTKTRCWLTEPMIQCYWSRASSSQP